MKLRGPGVIVEGDWMSVKGKRKCVVSRWHSKLHVYAITEKVRKRFAALLCDINLLPFYRFLISIYCH